MRNITRPRFPEPLSVKIRSRSPPPTPDPTPSVDSDVSRVSVKFTAEGLAHTATLEPSVVLCGDQQINASGPTPSLGSVSFPASGLGMVEFTISDELGRTRFRASEVSIEPASEGYYRWRGMQGEVSFWEGSDGADLDPEDAVVTTGSLSVVLVCP